MILDVGSAAGGWIALAFLTAVPSCCVVLVPAFLLAAAIASERAMGVRSARTSRWALGALSAPFYLAPLAALALGLAPFDADDASTLEVLLASLVSGVVVSSATFPFLAAPFEAIARGRNALAALVTAGARVAHRSLRSTLAHASAVGLVVSLPAIALEASRGIVESLAARAALFTLVGVASTTVSMGLVAHHWSSGSERFGRWRSTTPGAEDESHGAAPAIATLARSWLPLITSAVLLTSALLVAAAFPAPAWHRSPIPSSPHDPELLRFEDESAGAPLELDPRTGLRVYATNRDVWRIETADGGGAGDVRIPDGLPRTAVVRRMPGARGWELCVQVDVEMRCVPFDARGVRLDDRPWLRVRCRLGELGAAVFVLYAFLVACVLLVRSRRLSLAALLDDAGANPRAPRARALEGRLWTDTPLRIERGSVSVESAARLDFGPFGTVRLEEGRYRTVVAPEVSHVVSGSPITVMGEIDLEAEPALRRELPALPKSALLFVGPLEAARRSLADHDARINVLVSLPLLVLAVALSVWIFARL